ncbi:MAG: bifunctional hydroxymethylpyrimidine kinase/phosphomethylpyrimidine kinase [Acidobacteriota bacterium]|nr:bifunctional hydroxymethylpyrimidine kinase/phosphomethylpyrimidine kinase [Acidobacteriota bacterium]
MLNPPVVWTIAGYDPSSGAGITADLKTISAHACYGVSAITALTVQNTLGVRRVSAIAPETLSEILQALLDDFPPMAIKVGMLATAENATIVADFLSALPSPHPPVVLDPILLSSSGAVLLEEAGVHMLRQRLLPLATVVTPNLAEARVLTGLAEADPETLATGLRRLGAQAAVVTGGDTGNDASDTLAYVMGGIECVETLFAARIESRATHGTGCAFSTALACGLAMGQSIPAAATSAKLFVRRAIEQAPGLGKGKGPLGLDRV